MTKIFFNLCKFLKNLKNSSFLLRSKLFLLKSKIYYLILIKVNGYNSFDKLFSEFNKLMKITRTNKDLIRMGGGDGGYLVPTEIKKTYFLFSVGCDNKINFETEYLKNNFFNNSKVFIIDGKKCSINLPKNIFF